MFPCYIFVQCGSSTWNDIRYISGVSSLVHFGGKVPSVPDAVIDELRECFESAQPMTFEERLFPGAAVSIADGAFRGLQAIVLRTLPAKRRVEVLQRTVLLECVQYIYQSDPFRVQDEESLREFESIQQRWRHEPGQ